MVKGNKFKPGLPPLKKRKTLEEAAPSDQVVNLTHDSRPNAQNHHASRPSVPNGALHTNSANNKRKHVEDQKPAAAPKSAPNKRRKQAAAGGVSASKEPAPQSRGPHAPGAAQGDTRQPGHKPPASLAKADRGNHRGQPSGAKQGAGAGGKDPPNAEPGRSKAANQRKKARRKARQLAVGAGGGEGKGQEARPAREQVGAGGQAAAGGGTEQIGPGSKVVRGRRRKPPKGGVADTKGEATLDIGKVVLKPPPPGSLGNSNWASLKDAIGAGRKTAAALKGMTPQEGSHAKRPQALGASTLPTKLLAVDCEMVGVGPQGMRSSLARVCIVNDQGNVLMDKYVQQRERVRDYRTQWSGIRAEDLHSGRAEPFAVVQKEAADLFKGRIVVGHAIQNDLKALLLSHPSKMIRDTAKFPPLMRATQPGRKPKARALRHLAFEVLGLGIQQGEHSPVEDARCALYLYQRHAKVWEHSLQKGSMHLLKAPGQLPEGKGSGDGKTLAQLAARDVMVDL